MGMPPLLKYVLYAVDIFIIFMFIRMMRFRPKAGQYRMPDDVSVDKDKALSNLISLIKCRTVSAKFEYDEKEMEQFRERLKELFPSVFDKCKIIDLGLNAMIIRWKGTGSKDPILFAVHYDVYPVGDDIWQHAPFFGIVEEDALWGRGVIDAKCALNGLLMAVDDLIKEDYLPESDIYIALTGDSETDRSGASSVAEYFQENDIDLSMVLTEGSFVTTKAIPGVLYPSAVIGVTEKGECKFRLYVNDTSADREGEKEILKTIVNNIEKEPMHDHINDGISHVVIDTLGRFAYYSYRMVYGSLWFFKGLAERVFRTVGDPAESQIRSEIYLYEKEDEFGRPYVSGRMSVIPGESTDFVLEEFRKRIGDSPVDLVVDSIREPSPISDYSGKEWLRLFYAAEATWSCPVSPYIIDRSHDGIVYESLCDKIYRFTPVEIYSDEFITIREPNEHIGIDAVPKSVEFYKRFIISER